MSNMHLLCKISEAIHKTKLDNKRIRKAEVEFGKRCSEYAYFYMNSVIKESHPDLEPVMLQSPDHIYQYAYQVIKRRWPEGENLLLGKYFGTPSYLYLYAARVMKTRWLAAEPHILKNPETSTAYACGVLKGPWPEAEPSIVKDPFLAFDYINVALKRQQWEPGEEVIASYPRLAYIYSKNVLGRRRFPKFEKFIISEYYGLLRNGVPTDFNGSHRSEVEEHHKYVLRYLGEVVSKIERDKRNITDAYIPYYSEGRWANANYPLSYRHIVAVERDENGYYKKVLDAEFTLDKMLYDIYVKLQEYMKRKTINSYNDGGIDALRCYDYRGI